MQIFKRMIKKRGYQKDTQMRRYTWEGEARKERKESDTEVVHCLSKTQGQSWAGGVAKW